MVPSAGGKRLGDESWPVIDIGNHVERLGIVLIRGREGEGQCGVVCAGDGTIDRLHFGYFGLHRGATAAGG